MGYGSRLPDSNEPPRKTGVWRDVGEGLLDATAVLLAGGKRCCVCHIAVPKKHLVEDEGSYYCPDHSPLAPV